MPIVLSPDVAMPASAVTETFLVLANRGRGKSSTVTRLVEQMQVFAPIVVIDVKGDFWGLRSSADGLSEGLPFVLFGGDHADIPLKPEAGVLVADVVVENRLSAVVDLSLMSKTQARRFATDFAERLYHRNRDPLHVVVEEADVLIPQSAAAGDARMLGAYQDIAKRGRGRGLGLTVVTQRPQDVSKSVTELCETLILLGMTGSRSIAAVKEWLGHNADDSFDVGPLLASLPALPVGDAYVISPAFLRRTTRTHVSLFETFDSHRTPEPGEQRVDPQTRALVDLKALGAEIAATAERAKADDPAVLRRRVAELEARLVAQHDSAPELREARYAAGEAIERADRAVAARDEAREQAARSARAVAWLADRIGEHTTRFREELDADLVACARMVEYEPATETPASRPAEPPQRPAPPVAETPTVAPPRDRGDGTPAATGDLTKLQRAVLSALVAYGPRTPRQVGMLTGYAPKGGAFAKALAGLRRHGYVEGQPLTVTADGLDVLGPAEPLPTGPALWDHWCGRLTPMQANVLREIRAVHPAPLRRTEIAARTEVSAGGGAFSKACGDLVKLDLATIPGPGLLRLADDLADAVRAA